MNEFHKVQHLGTGNFTTIFKAVSKIDGKTYAIKQAEKAKLSRVRKEADLFMEKHCLSKLKCTFLSIQNASMLSDYGKLSKMRCIFSLKWTALKMDSCGIALGSTESSESLSINTMLVKSLRPSTQSIKNTILFIVILNLKISSLLKITKSGLSTSGQLETFQDLTSKAQVMGSREENLLSTMWVHLSTWHLSAFIIRLQKKYQMSTHSAEFFISWR